MKLIIYFLAIMTAIIVSMTAGLLIFFAYALDNGYLILIAIALIIVMIPCASAIDKIERKL